MDKKWIILSDSLKKLSLIKFSDLTIPQFLKDEGEAFKLLKFSRNCKFLFSNNANGICKVWDIENEKLIYELDKRILDITKVEFSEFDNWIIIQRSFHYYTILNTKSGKSLGYLNESMEIQEDEFKFK